MREDVRTMSSPQDNRLDFPATQRNADAILNVLKPLLGASPKAVLEIASGSGQHAVHMTTACPQLTWWPTDLDPEHILSIEAWRQEAGAASIQPATLLDVTHDAWRQGERQARWPDRFDGVVNANMIHISPWEAAQGLIEGASRHLTDGGFLYFYGPFKQNGEHTADSNLAFDNDLRARNPEWGVRDLGEVEAIAHRHGFTLEQKHEMPANNLSVVFRLKGRPL